MIEEFIDAMAECYDAKEELMECYNEYAFHNNREHMCSNYKNHFDKTKQKAEEIMRKIIRSELKVISND